MEETMSEIKFYGWITLVLISIMYFPFGLYLILIKNNYMELTLFLIGYALCFFCFKKDVKNRF